MPLFVFISGYLSKDIEKTQRKAFPRFLLPYLVWDSFYFISKEITI
jgi:fucose 4-O-acetylase-like acetyltransferase